MKFMYKHRGSITIFLLIIMLPMLVFSFSILDICKILLAKDSAQQATDLALNSGLTSYDKVLKDMYGLMATSKSEEELTDKVTDYYVMTLQSSGLAMTESDKLTVRQVFADLLGTDINADELNNNNNLLKVYATNLNGASTPIVVDKEEVSSVSNPDVMHRQIVEYMKYRGPIYITTGILEKINVLKDLPAQANATKSKLTFEKTLSDINNSSIAAYVMLQVFRDNNVRMETGNSAPEYQVSYPNEHIASRIIKFYSYEEQEIPYKSLSNEVGDKEYIPAEARNNIDSATIYGYLYYPFAQSLVLVNENGEIRMKLPEPQIIKEYKDDRNGGYHVNAAEDLNKAFSAFEDYVGDDFPNDKYLSDAINFFDKVANSPKNTDTSDFRRHQDELRNYVPFFSDSESTEFYKLCKNFLEAYIDADNYRVYLEEALEKEKDRDDEELNRKMDAVTTAIGDSYDYAERIVDNVELVKNKVDSWSYEAEKCYGKAQAQLNRIVDAVVKEKMLIEELTKDNGLFDEVYDLFEKAQNDAKTYSDNVNQIQTDSVKTSMNAQYVNEAADIKALNKADVDQLKNILKSKVQSYDEYLDIISSIKIYDHSMFLSKYKMEEKVIPAEKASNKFYTDLYLEWHNEPYTKTKYVPDGSKTLAAVLSNSIIDPDITSIKAIIDNYCPLVTQTPKAGIEMWTENNDPDIENNVFYKQLKKVATPAKEDVKDESAKEAIQDSANSTPSSDDIVNGVGSSSSSSGSSGSSNPSSGTSKPENNSIEKSNGDDFDPEDEKYMRFEEYIGDGYKSDKPAEQGKIDKLSEQKAPSAKGDNVSGGATDMLVSVGDFIGNIAKAARDNLYITEYLVNNFSCHTTKDEDVMLSGKPFVENKNANVVWYGSELEFILYGENTIEKNQLAAGAVIFGIRFVLNLIYSFTDPQINAFTTSAASAASAMFPFAMPLIKALLHIGLSIAESSYDLMVLRNGGAVPIFKDATTWKCKGTGIVREIVGEVISDVADKAIDAAVDGLTEEIENLANSGKDFVKEQNANVDKLIKEQTDMVRDQIKSDIITPMEDAIQSLLLEFSSGISKETIETRLYELLNGREDKDNDGKKDLEGIKDLLGINAASKSDEDDIILSAEWQVIEYIEASNVISNIADYVHDNANDIISSMAGVDANSVVNMEKVNLDSIVEKPKSFAEHISKCFDGVLQKIEDALTSVSSRISDAVNKAIDEAAEAAKKGVAKGAESIKSKIQSSLNKSIRGHEDIDINYQKSGKKASKSAMISMTYKDYLYIFTVIGLIANERNMLQRAAQLMQANCEKNGAPDYNINEACTLIKGESAATVRTVLFGATFDEGKLDLSGINRRYEFNTISYAGY